MNFVLCLRASNSKKFEVIVGKDHSILAKTENGVHGNLCLLVSCSTVPLTRASAQLSELRLHKGGQEDPEN